MKLSFRKAVEADIEFIVEGIIEAEKSGSDKLPYTTLFDLSEEDTAKLIRDILDEDIEGQEWCLQHFLIAEADGQQAACLSCWVEGSQGLGSGQLKAQAMAYFLDKVWNEAADKLKLLAEMQLPRLKGYVQLECIYTHKAFRGQGLAGRLIEFAVSEHQKNDIDFEGCEIQLLANNSAAVASYTKCGFLNRRESTCNDIRILDLLADGTRISMVLNRQNG